MSLLRSAAARLGGLLLVAFGAVTLTFAALKLVPGDPVEVMAGPAGRIGPAERAEIRRTLGLDDPLWQQYLGYLGRVLTGDLGRSYQQRKPVAELIGDALPATLQLAALALGIAALLVLAGALIGRLPVLRPALHIVQIVAVSIPVFWSGLVLLTVFAFALGWFPSIPDASLRSAVLPALALAIPISATIGQVAGSSLDESETEAFVESARARGAGRGRILLRHTGRHAVNPVLMLGALVAGSLVGGSVLVENTFGRRGLGRVMLEAITNRDLPVVLGTVLVLAIVFALVNLVADVLAQIVDPRLRRSVIGVASEAAR